MITNLGAGNPFDSMYKIQGVIQKAGTKEKIEFSFTHIGDSFRSGLLEKGQLSVRNLTGNGLRHGQAQSLFAWVQRVHVWVPNLLLLQTIKLKRFWVADRQTQAILGYRPSNSIDFGLQTVRLKRLWATDHQTRAILGCRL